MFKKMCTEGWKSGLAPDNWVKVVIVQLYKGTGSECNCKNYKEISPLSIVGKVYVRLVIVLKEH